MRNTTPVWELISHLWFLLVLVVLTTVSLLIFSQLRQRASTASSTFFANITTGKLSLLFLALGSRMPPSGVPCSLSTLPF